MRRFHEALASHATAVEYICTNVIETNSSTHTKAYVLIVPIQPVMPLTPLVYTLPLLRLLIFT